MNTERKLTKKEKNTRDEIWRNEYVGRLQHPKFVFDRGFKAGLDYQQTKLQAYADYVAGKITLTQLEQAIKEE